MTSTNQSLSKKDAMNTRTIRRAIIIVGVLLLLVIAAFSAYYYWDRFLPRGEQSPIEAAIQEAEQAVRENPQDPEQRLALARIYYENRMYPEALDHASQVLSIAPDSENALLIVGLSNIRLAQPAEAVPPLEHFIDLRKDSPVAKSDMLLELAYYFVGESYVKLGQYTDAIPPLEEALIITPTDADALYQLGLAKQSLGECDAALTHYQKAVRLVPDFTEAYQGMAECYAAENDPGRVKYARGMLAFGQKDYATAKTYLMDAVQTMPESVPALLGLGLTYEKLGDFTAASDVLQRAMTLDPHDLAVRQALGRIQSTLDALKSQEKSEQ